ncbi:MAG: hypothetical protein HW421_2252 [Ignavibacteria bacterium]|nr:hypothetical protein [Ignavibacteria bacterium]
MLKISTRLTLWYVFATGFIIIFMAFGMYYIYDAQRRTAIDSDLINFADFLTGDIGEGPTDLDNIFNELREKKSHPSVRLRALRFALATNDSVIFEPSVLPNLDSLINELENRKEFSFESEFNTIHHSNNDFRLYIKKIKLRRENLQLIVFTSLDRFYESLTQLRYILFFLSSISLLASGLIGLFIARKALSPVRDLTETASVITSENLDKRVPVGKSQDELALLARTFNDMIDRLDATFRSQQRFIADASHDIRTPLTVIQMELDMLLLRENISDEEINESLERCNIEIGRLSKLADNLLILARADSHQLKLDFKPVRYEELLFECISQLNNLAKNKNIRFRFNVSQSVESKADEAMLRRVFMNVLDNAIKYSPENEIISIDISKNKKYITINITNKGHEIPPELITKIFDRFQRGDPSRTKQGFGLGLAIAKALTEAHGGTIGLTSDVLNGTILKFSFPIQK